MKRADVTMALAELGARLTWDHVPEKALDRAKCCVLDFLGYGI